MFLTPSSQLPCNVLSSLETLDPHMTHGLSLDSSYRNSLPNPCFGFFELDLVCSQIKCFEFLIHEKKCGMISVLLHINSRHLWTLFTPYPSASPIRNYYMPTLDGVLGKSKTDVATYTSQSIYHSRTPLVLHFDKQYLKLGHCTHWL